MKDKEGSSSPLLLSPKVRVKSLKRRRVLNGNCENEFDDSTLELLNALRDIPPCCETKPKGRKPLPAIGSHAKDVDPSLHLARSNNEDKKPKAEFFNDLQLIDDAFSQNKERNESLKMTLRSRRTREATFISSNKPNILNLSDSTDDKQSKELKEDNKLDFNDNNSVFSDFSEDLVKDTTERKRRNRRTNQNPTEDKLTGTIVKAGRRISRLADPLPSQTSHIKNFNHKSLFLQDNDNPDTSRSSGSKSIIDDDLMLHLDADFHQGFESNSLSSEASKREEMPLKRRSRRHQQSLDELSRVENGFSDVGSVFSEDFSETYDPTFTSKNQRARNPDSLSSFSFNKDHQDSNGGIFTSPQRHKKRSRHHQKKSTENPFFSNDIDLLSTNSFCLPGDNEDSSYQGRKYYPKQQRRRPQKYLPPLSEHLTHSK